MDAGTMSANYQTWLNDRLTEIGGGNPPDLSVFPGPFFEYDNNELARNTFGVEFFIDHAFQTAHHKIRPWANVSYLYSRLEDDFIYSSDGFDTNAPDFLGGNETWFEFNENLGDDVNSPSEWKINLGLEWIHPDSGLFMQPAMRFVDKRRVFSFAYSNLRVEPTSVLVQEVPAYVAFDFSIGMLFGDVEAPTGSITFGVMNLFDDQHHESIEADEDLLTQEFDPTYTSVIGRSYSLRGELRF
jgi:outer membrane receptor protein involved in Fe transport